jgi:hypothetical protein
MANKPQTLGTFEARGIITVTPDTFQVDLKGKNNQNWNYSRINMKMEDGKGGTFYLTASDGFDLTKGRTIYVNIKDSEEQMQIQFADRHNETILSQVDERSFIRVALRKVPNNEGKMVWEYHNFLTLYDAINFLKDRLQTGMKLYVRGRTRYSTYNDYLNKDFDIQVIYLLPEDENTELGFKFSQNVLLTSDSVDDSKFDEELFANVKAKLYLKKKKDVYEVLTLPLIIRATEENKDKVRKMIDKFFKVDEDKVRRIRLEGKYNIGYIAAQVTEDDLPEEAKELIELGLYDKEEVLKMYANKERVDEMTVTRPVMYKDKNTNKPKVDYSDDEYTLDDLVNLVQEPEEVVVETEDLVDDDLSFLDELD